MLVKVGGVKLPVFAILGAVPGAVKAAKAEYAADAADGKVTVLDILDVIGTFIGKLGEAIAPAVARANGIDIAAGG